jgi:ATP-binding cassette subfamily A (ABC1) protein 3
VFFSRGSVASAAGGLIFFLGYFPYFFVQPNYGAMSAGQKAAACLLSPTCVGIGTKIISIFESSGQGLTSATAGQEPADGDPFTMNMVFGMLIIDCIIYMTIAWYIEAVFPGAYGVPRPPWFFLTSSYWCGGGGGYSALIDDGSDADDPALKHPENFQPDPAGRAGIQMHALRKVFHGVGGTKVVVNNLSLNLYEGQVTALLGRNGAGKTTTMSILVGLFPPTSGTATINGYDIVSDLSLARNSLGLCPQFDILFDTLTIDEHLYFYAHLKGTDPAQIKSEQDKFVADLELGPKRNALAGTLSGGQKRALSVGIAFIGGSRVVILDEPTSGMDPYKRRHTWYGCV